MDKQSLIESVKSPPVAYRADFAKITESVTAAILLSQVIFWTGKSTKYVGGWVEKSSGEMYDETGLTDKQQQTARAALTSLGFIECERKGPRGAMCYLVQFDAIAAALESHYSDRQKGDSGEIQTGKKAILNRQKGDSEGVQIGKKDGSDRQKGDSLLQENTQRLHSENTHRDTRESENPLDREPSRRKPADLSSIAEPLAEYAKHVRPVDLISHDASLRAAVARDGAEKITRALRQCVHRATEPGAELRYIPKILSLCNDAAKMDSWASDWRPATPHQETGPPQSETVAWLESLSETERRHEFAEAQRLGQTWPEEVKTKWPESLTMRAS